MTASDLRASAGTALIRELHRSYGREPHAASIVDAFLDCVKLALDAQGAMLLQTGSSSRARDRAHSFASSGWTLSEDAGAAIAQSIPQLSAIAVSTDGIRVIDRGTYTAIAAALGCERQCVEMFCISRREQLFGYLIALKPGREITAIDSALLEILSRELLHLLDRTEFAAWCREMRHPALLIGCAPTIRRVELLAHRFAAAACPVLITGGPGTGKELVARMIHFHGARRDRPFVAINCGAFTSDQLLASELFGHARGAFTDAKTARKGKFEIADGGTLFLDEVGCMSPAMQVSLLRTLRYSEIQKVGDDSIVRTVNTRVIAACNDDLHRLVAEGRFRQDVFSRLRVAHIDVPPLRERAEDIPLLVEFFLARIAASTGGPPKRVDDDTLSVLASMPWDENVAGLENCLTHAYLAGEQTICLEHLPASMLRAGTSRAVVCTSPEPDVCRLKDAVRRFEADFIRAALVEQNGNLSRAARRLGLSRQGLQKKLKSVGLRVGSTPDEASPLTGRRGEPVPGSFRRLATRAGHSP